MSANLFFVALINLLYRALLSVYELVQFPNNKQLWKLRWLFLTHYFFVRFGTTPVPLDRERDFIYGETPFCTAKQLLKWSGIKPKSTFWDLGAGRGGFLFFSAIYFKVHAIGVEYVSLFVEMGKWIAEKLDLTEIEWIKGDFLECDLSKLPTPDLVFIASTSFTDDTLSQMSKKLELLPAGTKVISLSSPLPSTAFDLLEIKPFWFSWGKATAYLQIRR